MSTLHAETKMTSAQAERSVKTKALLSKALLWIFLLLVAAFAVFPIVLAFFGSLKSNLELTTGTTLLPKEWKFDNYSQA